MGRYLVRGFIDGLLSTLGIVIGASTAIGSGGAVEASHIIIAAGIGGGVANGLSNILGAFMGEKMEMYKRFERVENAMLKEEVLRGTRVDDEVQEKVISSGLLDGVATLGGAIIPVSPFFLVPLFSFPEMEMLYTSVAASLTVFFFLGVYIGRISKENLILSGLKMAAFGAGTAIIAALIRLLI